jgi:hypothetical protein
MHGCMGLVSAAPCRLATPYSLTHFPVPDAPQSLPLCALEYVLRSPGLRLTSENEAFWLIRSWIDHQVCSVV